MRYFAMIDGRRQGPFTLEELEGAGVGPDTYVWCKAMADWQQAREVGEICRYFRLSLHDRMHPVAVDREAAEENGNDAAKGMEDIPVRWRRYIIQSGADAEMLPEKEDYSHPPYPWIFPAVIAILLCCPVTGAIALYYGLRSRAQWRGGKNVEAHASARNARIWVLASVVAACFTAALLMKFGHMA